MTEEREPGMDDAVEAGPGPGEEASVPDLGSAEELAEDRTEDNPSDLETARAEEDEEGVDRTGETELEADRPGEVQPGAEAVRAEDEDVERPSPEQVAATGAEFVTGLLEAMGLEGEVATRLDEETAHIEVTGESLGVLIGRRGQTLDALQEVTRTAVQRRLRSRIRLMVDVEAYRARRRESLADYAREMATRAKERGTEIELEPMPPYERKIVHDAVSEIEGASSYSEGEDPNRKVVIRGE